MPSLRIDFRRRIVSRGEPRLLVELVDPDGARRMGLVAQEPVEARTPTHLARRALFVAIGAIVIARVVFAVLAWPHPAAK
jgi:hypothetical protein